MGKIDSSHLLVTPLRAEMDLTHFCCSEEELNEFLKEDALTNHESLYSVTKVIEYHGEIVGYFTLITDTIDPRLVDVSIGKKYSYRKLPAVKIARLATDKNYVRRGIGTFMMTRIFRIVLDMIGDVGCRVITVDAKKNAQEFYQHLTFHPVNSKSDKEYVSMYIDIKPLIEKIGRNSRCLRYYRSLLNEDHINKNGLVLITDSNYYLQVLAEYDQLLDEMDQFDPGKQAIMDININPIENDVNKIITDFRMDDAINHLQELQIEIEAVRERLRFIKNIKKIENVSSKNGDTFTHTSSVDRRT